MSNVDLSRPVTFRSSLVAGRTAELSTDVDTMICTLTIFQGLEIIAVVSFPYDDDDTPVWDIINADHASVGRNAYMETIYGADLDRNDLVALSGILDHKVHLSRL